MEWGRVYCPSLPREKYGEWVRLSPRQFDLNMEHFGALCKLDLTEENCVKLTVQKNSNNAICAFCYAYEHSGIKDPERETSSKVANDVVDPYV